MRAFLRSSALAGLFLLTPTVLLAQVPVRVGPGGSGGSVELTKPLLDDGDFGAATSVLRATLYLPAGDRAHFFGQIPLVFATADGVDASTTLGNPELGFAFRTGDGRPVGSVSVVLPTAQEFGDDDYATGVGIFSDILHPERYSSELWAVNAAFTPSRALAGGGVLGFNLGGSVWVPKGDGDTELLGRYGAYMVRESGRARFSLDFAGLAILSQEDLDFSERTLHEVGGSIGLVSEGASPEFFVRVPLDEDVRRILTAKVGVRVVF